MIGSCATASYPAGGCTETDDRRSRTSCRVEEPSASHPPRRRQNQQTRHHTRRTQTALRLKNKVCHERKEELDVGKATWCGAVQEMKDWPFGAALRGRFQTATCCGSGNATVVSDVEKALFEVSGRD